MQGIFVNYDRPKTKKAVKEAVVRGELVSLEATSFFGDEYDGPISGAPDGEYSFVGPDPYKSRKFYGTLVKRGERITIT